MARLQRQQRHQRAARPNPYYLAWGGYMPVVGLAAFAVAYARSESLPFALGATMIAPMYLPAVLWTELAR